MVFIVVDAVELKDVMQDIWKLREYDQLKSHVQSYLCSMPVYSTLNFSCFLDVMKLCSLLPHSWVFPIAYLLYFCCTLCFSIKIAIHKQPSPDLILQSSIHCKDGQAKELPSKSFSEAMKEIPRYPTKVMILWFNDYERLQYWLILLEYKPNCGMSCPWIIMKKVLLWGWNWERDQRYVGGIFADWTVLRRCLQQTKADLNHLQNIFSSISRNKVRKNKMMRSSRGRENLSMQL